MVSLEPDALDSPACPFIGLADDPRTRFTFPHPDHRCGAGPKPSLVAHVHQAAVCLGRDFTSCDWYRAWIAPGSRPVLPSMDATPRVDTSG